MKLTKKHIDAIGMMIQGQSCQQIADSLGVSKQTIINWRADADFMREYERCIREDLAVVAGEAKEILLDLMRNSKNDNIRLKACQDVLSRAGFDAVAKSKVDLEVPQDIIITIE